MSALLVPAILALVGLIALGRGCAVFPVFLRGAEKGIQTAFRLMPTLIALLTAVAMLRTSGVVDLAGAALQPLLNRLGIPAECGTLMLLKPLSGSGGLALGREIMRACGVDSTAGRTAAVMLGASETSLYTISVYSGHLGLKKTRYIIPAAMVADLAAFASAAWFVQHLYG